MGILRNLLVVREEQGNVIFVRPLHDILSYSLLISSKVMLQMRCRRGHLPHGYDTLPSSAEAYFLGVRVCVGARILLKGDFTKQPCGRSPAE